MSDTEDLSVSIDVKCESNKLTKGFATELVNSMNCALEKITSSINSMNSNLSRRIGELQVSMDQQIALTARKADAAHAIATKARTEMDQLRNEVAELKKWCTKLQGESVSVQSQANSMETYSRRDNLIICALEHIK